METFLLLSLSLTVPTAADNARAALAIAQAQQRKEAPKVPVSPVVSPVKPPPAPVATLSYEEGCRKALAENKPLVVGNRCPPAVPTGFLGCRADFPDEEDGMFVGVPVDGKLFRVQIDFPPGADVWQVQAAVEGFRFQRGLK
jgi:hypothetical protein